MTLALAKDALKKYFGYDDFRPMQADIVQAVYEGKDGLVLMPTGGGKSICYQIPAITLQGVAIVVSPLISLMKDQVETLVANGISAAYFNSSQSAEALQEIKAKLLNEELKLLYVSPEKLGTSGFINLLKQIKISLFAIDEAHCISSWGHDFRPEYTKLGFLKQVFPAIPILALTATADRLTRRDIVHQLQLSLSSAFISSFDRPNLSIEIRPGQKRIEQILRFLADKTEQAGIIYCFSRKSTEDLAAKLQKNGIRALAYHANLPTTERAETQEDFINDKIQVICATVAFGMGIDKSNVRWVIHYNLPKNIEAYYQEIGRAGRDGAPAETLLFYSMADVMAYRTMFAEGNETHNRLQDAKLDQMLQFADAQICRRKILLNYFNEQYEKECGNCDVCQSPPQYIDGTRMAQMALSAIMRLQAQANMGILIDVLRGSSRQEILNLGYHNIKTYGLGKDIAYADWQSYLWQMVQLGLLEVALEDKHKLRPTTASKAVLKGEKLVQLVRPLTLKERDEIKQKVLAEKAKAAPRLRSRNALFEVLRVLRRQLAEEKGVPPYVVFSDATLEEMSAIAPQIEIDFRKISGVGEQKWQQYGAIFLKAIHNFLENNPDFLPQEAPKQFEVLKVEKGISPTAETSFKMFQSGKTVAQIATERGLAEGTISTHLIQKYEAGEDIDVYHFVTKEDIEQVLKALQTLDSPYKLREIYDFCEETLPYSTIRWCIAALGNRKK